MELQYYWDVLDKTHHIMMDTKENKIEYQPEMQTLYGISMANIIRSGYPFSLVDHSIKDNEKKKGLLDNFIEEIPDEPEQKSEPEDELLTNALGYTGITIEIKSEDGILYSCPENVMKRIMRDSYRTLILHETDDAPVKTEEIHEENVDVDIDFLEKQEAEKRKAEEEKKRLEEEAARKLKEKEEAEKEEELFDAGRLPDFGFYPQFPEDEEESKTYSSFMCNEHTVSFTKDSNLSPVSFMIYPLSWDKKDVLITDIFVVAISGGNIRTGVSRGTTSAVTMEFDSHVFMIRGSFKGGVFESQVNSMKAEEPVEDVVKKHIPSEKRASIYVRIPMSDGTLFVFPAVMQDNDTLTGLAIAAMAIQTQDSVKTLCPTSDGKFVINQNTLLECYWMGDTLYYDFQQQ